MASINSSHVQLARSLHPRLLRFFARYPPRLVSAEAPAPPSSSSADTTATVAASTSTSSVLAPHPHNPFVPRKSTVSSHWLGPVFSLRQQADLYKLAKQQGVAELLPFTSKSSEVRLRKREDLGLRVKGTGVGQSVKGHVKERFLKQKLEKREMAMRRMPGLIRFWKLRGKRRWQLWPRGGRDQELR